MEPAAEFIALQFRQSPKQDNMRIVTVALRSVRSVVYGLRESMHSRVLRVYRTAGSLMDLAKQA